MLLLHLFFYSKIKFILLQFLKIDIQKLRFFLFKKPFTNKALCLINQKKI